MKERKFFIEFFKVCEILSKHYESVLSSKFPCKLLKNTRKETIIATDWAEVLVEMTFKVYDKYTVNIQVEFSTKNKNNSYTVSSEKLEVYSGPVLTSLFLDDICATYESVVKELMENEKMASNDAGDRVTSSSSNDSSNSR